MVVGTLITSRRPDGTHGDIRWESAALEIKSPMGRR
jgi:hypothetical protein